MGIATNFTPATALAGGLLIGAAVAVLLICNGRIAGISGLLAAILPPFRSGYRAEPAAFLGGLIAAPLVYRVLSGQWPEQVIAAELPLLIVAGLLVGVGSALANGCTSGHGVCGLARLSPRSLVATGVFMAAGIATVTIARHVIG